MMPKDKRLEARAQWQALMAQAWRADAERRALVDYEDGEFDSLEDAMASCPVPEDLMEPVRESDLDADEEKALALAAQIRSFVAEHGHKWPEFIKWRHLNEAERIEFEVGESK